MMGIRLNVVDIIIFFDIYRIICVYRVFKRIVKYWNKIRLDMGVGCEERFDL